MRFRPAPDAMTAAAGAFRYRCQLGRHFGNHGCVFVLRHVIPSRETSPKKSARHSVNAVHRPRRSRRSASLGRSPSESWTSRAWQMPDTTVSPIRPALPFSVWSVRLSTAWSDSSEREQDPLDHDGRLALEADEPIPVTQEDLKVCMSSPCSASSRSCCSRAVMSAITTRMPSSCPSRK